MSGTTYTFSFKQQEALVKAAVALRDTLAKRFAKEGCCNDALPIDTQESRAMELATRVTFYVYDQMHKALQGQQYGTLSPLLSTYQWHITLATQLGTTLNQVSVDFFGNDVRTAMDEAILGLLTSLQLTRLPIEVTPVPAPKKKSHKKKIVPTVE